jgi:hypothetical protein
VDAKARAFPRAADFRIQPQIRPQRSQLAATSGWGEAFERSSFGKWRRTRVDTTREALNRIDGNAETYDDSRRSAESAGATGLYARAATAMGSHYILDAAGCSTRGAAKMSHIPTRQAAFTPSTNTAVEDNP